MPLNSMGLCQVTPFPTLAITEARLPIKIQTAGLAQLAVMLKSSRIPGKLLPTVGMVAIPKLAMLAMAERVTPRTLVMVATRAITKVVRAVRTRPQPEGTVVARLARPVEQVVPVVRAGQAAPRPAEPSPQMPLVETVERAVG